MESVINEKRVNAIEKIKKKHNDNICIISQEIEDIVNKFKTNVDRTIINLRERTNDLVQGELLQIDALQKKDKLLREKCAQYYRNLENRGYFKEEIRSCGVSLIDYLVEIVPNQKYLNSIFRPCISYLQQVLQNEVKKIDDFRKNGKLELENEYKEIIRLKYKSADIKRYGELVVTRVPEIERKYDGLIKETAKVNDTKYLKVSLQKRPYLYRNKKVYDIGTYFGFLIDDCEDLRDLFESWNMYNYGCIDIVTCYCLIKALSKIANLINRKYSRIMNNKTDLRYFSKVEYVKLEEVRELLDEYNDVQNRIKQELEPIRNPYLQERVHTFLVCDVKTHKVVDTCEEMYTEDEFEDFDVALGEEKILKEYLCWIFSKDKIKKPKHLLIR